MFHRLARIRRWVVVLVGAAMLTSLTPQTAHAIGCGDEVGVTFMSGKSPEPGSTEIYTGSATRTSTGLLEDTYTFTAYDIATGREVTGTFTVTTADCLAGAAMGTPVVGTVESWEYSKQAL